VTANFRSIKNLPVAQMFLTVAQMFLTVAQMFLTVEHCFSAAFIRSTSCFAFFSGFQFFTECFGITSCCIQKLDWYNAKKTSVKKYTHNCSAEI